MDDIRQRVRDYLTKQLNDEVNGRRIAAATLAWTAGYREEQLSNGTTRYIPTGENSEQLAEMAKTDGAAWDACLMLTSGCVERGEVVPEPLRKVALAVLRKNSPGPSGKAIWGNLHRDLVICMGVAMLEQQDIAATRNDFSRTEESGCDLVADMVSDMLPHPMSYGTLKKIWLHYRGHVHEVMKHGPFYFQHRSLKLTLKKR